MTTVYSHNHIAVSIPCEGSVKLDILPIGVGEAKVTSEHFDKSCCILDKATAEIRDCGIGHVNSAVGIIGVGCQILRFESPVVEFGGTNKVGTVKDNL